MLEVHVSWLISGSDWGIPLVSIRDKTGDLWFSSALILWLVRKAVSESIREEYIEGGIEASVPCSFHILREQSSRLQGTFERVTFIA